MASMTQNNHIPLHPVSVAPLHIASLALQVFPAHLSATKDWLTQQAGVEIHAEDPVGKLVVVVETDHERAITQLLDKMVERPGVLNASLIYHEILTEESRS